MRKMLFDSYTLMLIRSMWLMIPK
ncbi:hypothetical protein EMIT0324P_220014 [Pseudomonas chlororaphis]